MAVQLTDAGRELLSPPEEVQVHAEFVVCTLDGTEIARVPTEKASMNLESHMVAEYTYRGFGLSRL